ncbi:MULTISPECIES: DUF397 domain-containing protein [Streptomyces]|uniref:DUF397 domain-containing protein n=1 Tax=Streptomyces sudanensis TaxID=436397 RepID=A0ABY4TIL6_9ACTN|nr:MULTISPECIES: DUF397 domain-containing protein [Streptomyces]URN18753.1 DUF397 domain-containing protein [Streptomyces sudanensis]
MAAVEPDWRTSAYTGTENCVGVTDDDPHRTHAGDTKDRDGTALSFPPGSRADSVDYGKRFDV